MSTDPQPSRFVHPSRRRDKPILSCTLCRRRKLKCDRQQPCKTCVDRGLSLSCTYVRNMPTPKEPKIPNSVHDRINQLEKLVTNLMSGKDANHVSPTPSHTPQHQDHSSHEILGTPDRVKFNDETTSYTSSGHWTSILDGISELREHLDQIPTSSDARCDDLEEASRPEILFGLQRLVTKEDILAAIPPRPEADQLMEAFFTIFETHATFLHKPTFVKQYQNFWLNSFETPTMWVGLLYVILATGARFQANFDGHMSKGVGMGPNCAQSLYSARTKFYREKAVQCMILANYTKCPPATIEAFMLYCGSEFSRSADAQFSTYMVVGMLIRLAFRVGLHRDPSRFPNISPFEGEMRRRKWNSIMSLDLVTSAQLGLPRMIQPYMYDTQEPRNLNQDDIYEDMTELPPSRSEAELTQLLYFILLTRIRKIQAQILDLIQATPQPPYQAIIDIDTALRSVYSQIPKSLETKNLGKASVPSKLSLMRYTYLELAYLKAQVMLHRPYLKLGRVDKPYEYSRKVCLNAAIELLSFQNKLDADIQPGDEYSSLKFRMTAVIRITASIVAQDFLLATSVLVLDLDEDLISPLPNVADRRVTGVSHLEIGMPTREEIIESLRSAYHIWLESSKRSQEAKKVAAAVRLVLSKVGEHEDHTHSPPHSVGTTTLEHNGVYPSPDFVFNEHTPPRHVPNLFPAGDDSYSHSLLYSQMPMDLDSLNIPLDWEGMMSHLDVQQYNDAQQRSFQ
ncbi:hypothetical protein COCSADRAFT_178261 [Bipolaris sorokiniana ND90Pr]|uniref:Zn(2)-C6 fungal-type domain-containing protein n=1 Tax=Cochliobolus sativus (strain ND90Pr / ATCC 201652) TaxID=665912 RepID=M2SMP0_COCSN|nr:uncharacterized protein COCSADRAFT_178261 [Bipolaris sorokiniana ND90Pr]EMD68433.1 hypothetical protein COCSADRAFT_178261 [Bipolaris sorokiniana ND90Pr]